MVGASLGWVAHGCIPLQSDGQESYLYRDAAHFHLDPNGVRIPAPALHRFCKPQLESASLFDIASGFIRIFSQVRVD